MRTCPRFSFRDRDSKTHFNQHSSRHPRKTTHLRWQGAPHVAEREDCVSATPAASGTPPSESFTRRVGAGAAQGCPSDRGVPAQRSLQPGRATRRSPPSGFVQSQVCPSETLLLPHLGPGSSQLEKHSVPLLPATQRCSRGNHLTVPVAGWFSLAPADGAGRQHGSESESPSSTSHDDTSEEIS